VNLSAPWRRADDGFCPLRSGICRERPRPLGLCDWMANAFRQLRTTRALIGAADAAVAVDLFECIV